MAISATMQCLKVCGYLCGTLAAINIWFWVGMTIMQATASDGMGNPWINKEILLYDKFLDPDAHRFVTVFAICILLNLLCFVGCCYCTTCSCYQDKDQVVYFTSRVGEGDSNHQ